MPRRRGGEKGISGNFVRLRQKRRQRFGMFIENAEIKGIDISTKESYNSYNILIAL